MGKPYRWKCQSSSSIPTREQVDYRLDEGDWVVLDFILAELGENEESESFEAIHDRLAREYPECAVFRSSPSTQGPCLTIKRVTPQDAIDCRMGEIWEAVQMYQNSRSIDPQFFTEFVQENELHVVASLIEDDFHNAARILREYFKVYPKTGNRNEQA